MKSIYLIVVESSRLPGVLSFRLKPNDPTATPFYKALTESGAKVGDILELRLADPDVTIEDLGNGES